MMKRFSMMMAGPLVLSGCAIPTSFNTREAIRQEAVQAAQAQPVCGQQCHHACMVYQ